MLGLRGGGCGGLGPVVLVLAFCACGVGVVLASGRALALVGLVVPAVGLVVPVVGLVVPAVGLVVPVVAFVALVDDLVVTYGTAAGTLLTFLLVGAVLLLTRLLGRLFALGLSVDSWDIIRIECRVLEAGVDRIRGWWEGEGC